MAIAFDASSSGNATTTNTCTVSHTCTGTNLKLIVGVSTNTTTNITGVTYNGVAMTQIGVLSTYTKNYLFYLDNPATGTHNIVATASAVTGGIGVTGMSYTGCDTGIDNSNTGQIVSSNSVSVSVTPSASNCWVVGFSNNNGTNPLSNNANTTARTSFSDGSSGGCCGFDTNGVASGSTTMSTKIASGNVNWSMVIASIPPKNTVVSRSIIYLQSINRSNTY